MQLFFLLLYIALGIAQIIAYLEGIHLWLGVGTLLGLVIFFVSAGLPFGAVADAAIAFYGAYKGWHWPWWQAALLSFPFAIIGIIVMSLSGMAGMAGIIYRRHRSGGPSPAVAAYQHSTSPRIGRRGICMVCGSIKSGSYVPCEECGFQPITDEDLAISLMLNEANVANFDQIALGLKSGRRSAFERGDIEKFITSSSDARRMLGLKGDRYDTRMRTESLLSYSVEVAVSMVSEVIAQVKLGDLPTLSRERILAVLGIMLRAELIGRAPRSEKTFIRRFFGKRLVLKAIQSDLPSQCRCAKEEFAARVAQALLDADTIDLDFVADKYSLEKAVLAFVLPGDVAIRDYTTLFHGEPYIGSYLRIAADSYAKAMDGHAASWK